MIRRSFVLVVALGAASCGGASDPCAGASGTCVALTVRAATATTLDSLQVVASGAAAGTKTSAFGRTRSLPVTLAVHISEAGAAGALMLSVTGSRSGSVVAAGATSVDVVAGKHVTAEVDLHSVVAGADSGAPDDLASPPDLTGVIPCTSGSQCPSQLCNQTTHQCAHDMCDDGIKDGSETAVDCGGPTCATRCAVTQSCSVASDCLTNVCDQLFCQSVSLAWRSGPALPVFDPTWTATPEPGHAYAVTLSAAGVLYVISGIGQVSANGNAYEMGRVQYLDLGNGDTTWSLGDSIPQAVSAGGGGLGNDGKIYAGLGNNHNSSTTAVYQHAVRPAAGGTWTTVTSPPLEKVRADFAYFTDPSGLIYFMGGGGATTNNYSDTYDAKNAAWGSGPTMTALRDGLMGVYASGLIYAIGGIVDGGSGAPVGTTEAYDPTPKTWKTLASLQTPRRSLAGAVGADGRIYAIGGSANTTQTPVANVEAYTPATNVWTTVTALTHPRIGLGVVVAPDGTLWAIAGDDGSGQSPWVEIYGPLVTPATKTPTHGTTLALTGSSFAPHATVTASIAGQTVGTATTDASGALIGLTVTLPSTVGAIAIQVVDDLSNYPVTVNVTAQ